MDDSERQHLLAEIARRDEVIARQAAEIAKAAGAEVTYVDLTEFQMPVYNGDEEENSGLPEATKRLKKLFVAADGMVLSCPEYNGSIPGAFKNTLDWLSRSENSNEPGLAAYKNKTGLLLSASPGALGGMRGLVSMRMFLATVGVHVLPDQLCVSKAHEAFDESGHLKDAKVTAQLKGLVEQMLKHTGQHQS